mmetsp:Transcript_46506/g.104546  ORF Transcript_46506/g.104546 Transcript_46506/m.104546 type:complete len:307 (-) Transcript_46506:149-1069(-)
MGEAELLWNAVAEAVGPIAHLETQWEQDKLEKKVREYFKKGARGLQFNAKPWQALINEYTDSVFSSLFCGLGDRDWLPQADFLLCVDAGVKDYFPSRLFTGVPQQVFEQTVLQAADRAFDEQRYWNVRWETIQRAVTGKGTQKKVREALDSARAEAVAQGPEKVEDFVSSWIQGAMNALAKATQGNPADTLPVETCVSLFQSLIQDGCLPLKLAMTDGIPPRGWPTLSQMITDAYAMASEALENGKLAAGGTSQGMWNPNVQWQGVQQHPEAWGFGGWVPGPTMMSQAWSDSSSWQPPAKRFKGGW